MTSPFNSVKSSQNTGILFKRDFDAFFENYGGKSIRAPHLPESRLRDTQTYTSRIQQLIKEVVEGTGGESNMYKPLTKLLTLVSLAVAKSGAPNVLVFVENTKRPIRQMIGCPQEKPDLVGFLALRSEAQKIVAGETVGLKIPPAYGIEAIVEVKVKSANAGDNSGSVQALRYVFNNSKHHPESYLRHALIIDRECFQLLSVGLDYQIWWPEVTWKDDTDCITDLLSCLKIIDQEATKKRIKEIPEFNESIEFPNKRPIGVYSVKIKKKTFRLLPIFSGRGNGRKPFVALGTSRSKKSQTEIARVFKYSWYPKSQRDMEKNMLKELHDAPGVVRLDDDMSNIPDTTNKLDDMKVELDGLDERELDLLVLSTVGHPLSSCGTVLEFLEAMYDLLEVLRFLAHERNVLHRDISWGNILIRPKEYAEPVNVKESISRANGKAKTAGERGIPHNYRFISDVFQENDWKVRIALADFNHATKADNISELKDATGTPMFMAFDLLSRRRRRAMFPSGPATQLIILSNPDETSTLNCPDSKYGDNSEKTAWDEYYKDKYKELEWSIPPEEKNEAKLAESFKHGAVHDAESVFYLCVLFFNRMWPCGMFVDESEREDLAVKRGAIFRILAGRKPQIAPVSFMDELPEGGFGMDDNLKPFYNMLQAIYSYLRVPWYNVTLTGRGDPYEFHLHDFMQRLFLHEIMRMREGSKPIPIENTPIPVKLPDEVTGNRFTTLFVQTSMIAQKSKKDATDVTAQGNPQGRQKRPVNKNMNEGETYEDGSERPVADTDVAGERITFPDTEKVPGRGRFSELFWSIYWAKEREKLWFASNMLHCGVKKG